MLRRTITLLLAAAAVVSTAAMSAVDTAATTGVAVDGVTDGVADGVTDGVVDDGVTVVGMAILAPTAFELAAAPKLAAATVDPACQDSTYELAPWRLPSMFSWYYNSAGTPASVASTALTAVRNGTWTLFHAGYRCGSTTSLSTTERYVGSTTRVAQVSATGTCTGNDNVSVVSWGRLPSSTLAYTCVYYRTSSKVVLASDTLIDNTVHQWFTTLPAGCYNKFDLQSVMVHERGHSAGLAHVDQVTRAAQTMSPKTPPCSTARRTLALGDVTGMKAMYLG